MSRVYILEFFRVFLIREVGYLEMINVKINEIWIDEG